MGISAPARPPESSPILSTAAWSVAVIVAAVVGFSLGRITVQPATSRESATVAATKPAQVAAEPARAPTAKAVEQQVYEVPLTPEPTNPPPPDARKAGDEFIGSLEKLGAQSRALASSLRNDPALRYGIPDAVLNGFANELDLAARAADDAIECVKRGDRRGADLAFERSQTIFERVRRELTDELQRGRERVR